MPQVPRNSLISHASEVIIMEKLAPKSKVLRGSMTYCERAGWFIICRSTIEQTVKLLIIPYRAYMRKLRTSWRCPHDCGRKQYRSSWENTASDISGLSKNRSGGYDTEQIVTKTVGVRQQCCLLSPIIMYNALKSFKHPFQSEAEWHAVFCLLSTWLSLRRGGGWEAE